jgi:hypothetical protein
MLHLKAVHYTGTNEGIDEMVAMLDIDSSCVMVNYGTGHLVIDAVREVTVRMGDWIVKEDDGGLRVVPFEAIDAINQYHIKKNRNTKHESH